MLTLKLCWLFIKKYWSYILFIVIALFAIFFGSKTFTFSEELKKIRDIYDNEIKQIDEIRTTEKLQHKENQKKFNDRMAIIEKNYEQQQKTLDDKKRKEVETIVKNYSDKPIELAEQLKNATGFTIIMPKDE